MIISQVVKFRSANLSSAIMKTAIISHNAQRLPCFQAGVEITNSNRPITSEIERQRLTVKSRAPSKETNANNRIDKFKACGGKEK